MKLFLKKTSLIILFFTGMAWLTVCKAVEEEPIISRLRPITTQSPIQSVDDKFNTSSWSTVATSTASNTITLKLLDNKPIVETSFSYQVTLKIEYYTYPKAALTTINGVILNVNYDSYTGASYKNTDTYAFTGAYDVKVTVTNISTNGLISPAPDYFELSNTIAVDREYTFAPATPINPGGTMLGSNSEGGQLYPNAQDRTYMLYLSWPLIVGAQEYDLEWTTTSNIPVRDNTIAKYFKNNATRITTSDYNYKISLLYDDKYLLVRMRQVQYKNGIRYEGDWDYKMSGGAYNVWDIIWHQQKLNWQYTATFAEEGKKKEVVNYFDGSLRNRQTVTLSNSDKVALIQENVYDKFGRQTASILPAPYYESNGYLRYVPKFNLSTTNTAYSAANINMACEITPSKLDSTSGAARYYSGKNDFKNLKNYNQYIPNAQQYPLSLTQYTADNTGRIKIQGGVGPIFQPGLLANKATRYYYGKPYQWELDQLFGNDVGYAEHYQKNTVIDANGQASITYLNASGKTIATALAGTSPGNLDALANVPAVNTLPQTISILLKPEQFTFDNSEAKLRASTTYTSTTAANTATINYNIERLIHTYKRVNASYQICSTCNYELKITFKDACGKSFFTPTTDSIVSVGTGQKFENPNPIPTLVTIDSSSFTTKPLGIDTYYITFELAINQSKMEEFLSTLLANDPSIRKEGSFIMEKLNAIDFTTCFNDCRTAEKTKAEIGTVNDFRTKIDDKLKQLGIDLPLKLEMAVQYATFINEKYASILNKYNIIAGNPCDYSPCKFAREQMLRDVSPGGQYALSNDVTNVLTVENLQKAKRNFIKPIPEEVINLLDGSGTISPFSADFTLPQLLTYWKPEWAKEFLPYHPEYCKLQFCESIPTLQEPLKLNINPCKNEDEKLKNTSSLVFKNTLNQVRQYYAETLPNAPVITTDEEWLLKTDMFFNTSTGPGKAYYNDMKLDLEQYSTRILKSATVTVDGVTYTPTNKSLLQLVAFQLYCADDKNKTGSTTNTANVTTANRNWENCTPAPNCRVPEREWNLYRYYYLELKEKYYKILRDKPDRLNSCYTGTNCGVGVPKKMEIIGQPKPAQGCPLYNDFTITVANQANAACSTLENNMKLAYASSTLERPVQVLTEYTYNSTIVKGSYILTPAQPSVNFCLPNALSASEVRITGVACVKVNPRIIAIGSNEDSFKLKRGRTSGQDSEGARFPYITCNRSNFVWGLPFYDCNPNPYDNTINYNCAKSACDYSREIFGPPNYRRDYGNSSQFFPLGRSGVAFTANSGVNQDDEMGFEAMLDVLESRNYEVGYSANDKVKIGSYSYFNNDEFDLYPISTVESDLVSNAKSWCLVGNNNLFLQKGKNKIRVSFSKSTPSNQYDNAIAGLEIYDDSGILSDQFEFTTSDYKNQLGIIFTTGDFRDKPQIQTFRTRGTGTNKEIIWHYVNVDNTYYDIAKYDLKKDLAHTSFTPITPLDKEKIKCNLLANKTSRFDIISTENAYAGTNTIAIADENKATAQNIINENVTSSCKGNAEAWMNILDPGIKALNLTEAQKKAKRIELKEALIAVCTAGGDEAHPYGASSVNPNNYYSNADTTFGDAILRVFGLTKFTPLLNPYLFDGPAPYDTPQQLSLATIGKSKSSICNLLKSVNINNINAITDADLINIYGMPASDLEVLKKSCDQCKYLLSRDIKLPAVLDANPNPSVKSKYDRGDYFIEKAILQAQFAAPISVNVPNYRIILTNYFNQKWGFALGYTDYQKIETGEIQVITNKPPFGDNKPFDAFNGVKTQMGIAVANGKRDYATYIEDEKNKFRLSYINTCASAKTNASLSAKQSLYHYTLYYYDQAGNLVRTVPPAGVTVLKAAQLPSVSDARKNGTAGIYPAHTLATTYTYNATNQVIQQQSPDGGTNKYWYDMLSRLVFSQNDVQKVAPSKCSYTQYDVLGRIVEVGQKEITNGVFNTPAYLGTTTVGQLQSLGTNSQITRTVYDAQAVATTTNNLPSGILTGLTQNNLRKRVSASLYYDNPTSTAISGMYYNYDLNGNVKTLYRQIPGLGTKKVDYEFDLISGKVNLVAYQHGQKDQFYYQYIYDAENRLTQAWSSVLATIKPNGVNSYLNFANKRMDASYTYYLHGPLARVELGEELRKVQRIDYAYTLQGWLKGVNGNALDASAEMGKEGNTNSMIARDALAFALNYYTNDYKAIGTNTAFKMSFDAGGTHYENALGGSSLYNGNISSTTLAISAINNSNPVGYVHRYDQLNRLKQTLLFNLTPTTTTWGNYSTVNANYRELLSYDANGNILTLLRNGTNTQQDMDNLSYNYKAGTNQLSHVADAVAAGNYPADLDSQQPNNYSYDKIGNLLSDASEGITNIDWNVYGKIKTIAKPTGNINYTYDPAGNRQSKNNTAETRVVYYVRDAQGNILANYSVYGSTIVWDEQHLYGSSRLGIWNPNVAITESAGGSGTGSWKLIGRKQYELTNHLGNVLTTISDKRKGIDTNADGIVDYYTADVTTAQDYYPGGMPQPGRGYQQTAGKSYGYSFNSQQKSDEIAGKGNHTFAKFWEYDTRLVRRWNLDPKPTTGLSDYSTMSGNPIWFTDVLGDKPTPKQAAAMASHAYGDKKDGILRGGWKVSKRDFGIKKDDAKNGLKSQVYEKTTKGKTEYVYATAGTDTGEDGVKDWKQNALQSIGMSGQYKQSIDNAIKIDGILGKGTELTFTGHSLGGGEAAANAFATGRDARTFNAAGVSPFTMQANRSSKIDAYIMFHDPLNAAQNNISVMPDVDGTRHYMMNYSGSLLTGGHSLDNFLNIYQINPSFYQKPK